MGNTWFENQTDVFHVEPRQETAFINDLLRFTNKKTVLCLIILGEKEPVFHRSLVWFCD